MNENIRRLIEGNPSPEEAEAAQRRVREEWADLAHRADEAVEGLNRQLATCHERVACPKCCARIGQKCAHLRGGSELKSPHAERIRADGIALR